MSDPVNHPAHYAGFSNGAEVIDITENLSFNLGNVVKYVARAGRKSDDPIEDLLKAQFYLRREIGLLGELPPGLHKSAGTLFEDASKELWRWAWSTEDNRWRWEYLDGVEWIPVVGAPSATYGPFKEKHG